MQEVAVTTSYTGAKMIDDQDALDRISTVDEDKIHLDRFWEESRADISQELIGLVTFEGMVIDPMKSDKNAPTNKESVAPSQLQCYKLILDVSKSFDNALLPSMNLSLFSFFVHSIVAKWYIYTNKKEAGEYADKAVILLDDIHRKAVYKKKPSRPTYDD